MPLYTHHCTCPWTHTHAPRCTCPYSYTHSQTGVLYSPRQKNNEREVLPGVHVAHTLREWMLEVPVRVRIGTACMHPKHPPSLTTRNKTTSLCVTCDDDVVNNFKYTSLKHSLIATVDPRMGRSLRVTSPTFFRYVS